MPESQNSVTLLSAIQKFQSGDALIAHNVHPFASSSDASTSFLQDLLDTTNQLSHSLNMYMSILMSNPKLISLLRQHASISHKSYVTDHNIRQTIDALRKRPGSSYGEDVPLDRKSLVEWCISRIETWGTAAGMETFKDEDDGGKMTMVLGGKVLVIDLVFSINREDVLNPRVDVTSVKTSYAVTGGLTASSTEASVSSDTFIADSIRDFCTQAQKNDAVRESREVARLGNLIVERFNYLMMLDKLATRTGDGGIRWFTDVDQSRVCLMIEQLAKSEAEAVASSLSVAHAPLDIFLLRSHALPLPFLVLPSTSFLTYISPPAYISLLRTSVSQSDNRTSQIDIPISHLRSFLTSHPRPPGITIATLFLLPGSYPMQLFDLTMPGSALVSRPTFPLAPAGVDIDHIFPQTIDTPGIGTSTGAGQHAWVLDFTEKGNYPGVVMSQLRMREIELIINPLSGMDNMDTVGVLSFGTGSWVDLLLNPTNPVPVERYTALYRSPTSMHPPLQLRLTTPEEPGFLLEKIRVVSMKQIWGILEVVREQCWLNEILNGCRWTTERLNMEPLEPQDSDATEEDLKAALDGTMIPHKIPVNIYISSHHGSNDTLFGDTLDSMSISHRRPKIVMTSPERAPMFGLVEITVAYNESRPRGISVDVGGPVGADLTMDVLEEVSRRGGTLGLPGRVWASARS